MLTTRLRSLLRRCDFLSAKTTILNSTAITLEEANALRMVNTVTSPNDGMYRRLEARHYLGAGLSALRCIEFALNGFEPKTILDFPCGHGRVLRFLKARYPNSDIVGIEIDRSALSFCREEFGVEAVESNAELQIDLDRTFDLIWCGSLVTHLDEVGIRSLLRFFQSRLSPNGVCVLTAQGDTSARWMSEGLETYGLTDDNRKSVLEGFYDCGFGYASYEGQSYGVSLLSRKKMNELAGSGWNEVLYMPHGWDNHQDVYGFSTIARACQVIEKHLPEKLIGRWRPAF
jgi:hypothetical protein